MTANSIQTALMIIQFDFIIRVENPGEVCFTSTPNLDPNKEHKKLITKGNKKKPVENKKQ